MISFVIPAYNEEAFISATLQAIHHSARAVNEPYEIVVADDASTDRTAEIAQRLGARVERVKCRQIARTRNAGARASNGEFIFFVDADTLTNPRTLRSALASMKQGAAGGGAMLWFRRTEALPAYVWLGSIGLAAVAKLTGFTGGPFMYCTRAAFNATGGFRENMYWAEENPFGLALKREGKFVVPWSPIITSGRRFRRTAEQNSFAGMERVMASPKKLFTDRSVVHTAWYTGQRSDANVIPSDPKERVARFIWFVFVASAYLGILGTFVPEGWISWPGAVGTIVSAVTIPIAHLGLLFWPAAALVTFNLLRQKQPTSIVRSLLTIAFCLWLAWNSSRTVVEAYGRLWRWLTGLVGMT